MPLLPGAQLLLNSRVLLRRCPSEPERASQLGSWGPRLPTLPHHALIFCTPHAHPLPSTAMALVSYRPVFFRVRGQWPGIEFESAEGSHNERLEEEMKELEEHPGRVSCLYKTALARARAIHTGGRACYRTALAHLSNTSLGRAVDALQGSSEKGRPLAIITYVCICALLPACVVVLCALCLGAI